MSIFTEVPPRFKKGHKDIEDILSEVALEEEFTKTDVKEVYEIHKKYIKHLMEKEECFKIKLPFFGFLYYSTNMAKMFYRTEFFREKSKKVHEMRKVHRAKYTAFYKYLNFKKSSIRVLYENICKTIGKDIKKTTRKEERELIEKFSNDEL